MYYLLVGIIIGIGVYVLYRGLKYQIIPDVLLGSVITAIGIFLAF